MLYPEKDYLYQVYYLFANILEYVELLDAKAVIHVMTAAYEQGYGDKVFDIVKEKLSINEKYRTNFENLLTTAKLPLKLLVYKKMLNLMQEIIIDRKKLFIVTNGLPERQLNKIKQTEWHGLEQYLICYFAEEIMAKPEPDVINLLLKDHGLKRRDMLMIENSETDVLCAEAVGIDYFNVKEFL